jgi:glycosyltransferase involved in cell wall biosynthesis
VRLWRVLRRWAKDREIDLVEVPDWQGLAAGFPPLGVPVVVRCHGSHTYFRAEAGARPAPLERALEAVGMHRARVIVAASEHTWERTRALLWLGRRTATIVANPVLGGPAGPAVDRDRRLVVFSGTLTAKKGVVRLAEAWPSVLAELPDARLVIAGKDGEAPGGGSMQAHLVATLGPSAASVRFEGHLDRPELFGLLERAGAAVYPSYAEAFGLAPMEALAHGAPTIYTTRRPGPDLLTDGVDALLVDPDDVAALAEAIVALLRDPDRADALAAAGRARVIGTYGPAAVLPANLDVWQGALR